MKSSLLVSFLALTVSVVGFVILLTDRPSSAPRSLDSPGLVRPIGAPGSRVSGDDSALAARVDALVEENRVLRERLTNLELRPQPAQRTPLAGESSEFVGREEFDRFRDELETALGRARTATKQPGKPLAGSELTDFREHVAEALLEIRKQEAVGKLRSLDQRREELDETMPKLEEWLGLSRSQSDRLRSVLLAKYEREADILRRWQAGEDDEVLGAMKETDREVHRTELAEILTPEQLATYTARVDRAGK